MADVMAIVAKAIFEKAAGKSPAVGSVLQMDRYVSANKALAPAGEGGRLFLVTVRPPNEALWLVAILDRPSFDGTQWISAPSTQPITDITALKDKLKFATGKGITAAPGALGMSLQTPRVMTPADAALLTGAPAPEAPLGKLETGDRPRKDALIQAVLDDPDSELPRQVYADERVLHNDPRGEYILLELALAKPLSIRKRAQLEAERDKLLEQHGKTWFGKARSVRGFIERAVGPLGSFPDAIFDAQPIRKVEISGVEGKAGAGKLLEKPWLPRVKHLVIKGSLGDAGFAALVGAPAAQQLEHLNLTGNGIKLPALGTNLARLENLSLTNNPLKDDGVAALAKWPHLAQLDTLYLSKTGLTDKGLRALLAGPLPGLTRLFVSGNKLGGAGMAEIAAAAKRLPNLARLEVVDCGLDDAAATTLLAAKLPRLRSIDARENKLVSELDPRLRR